jgi:hypothetical protein
MKFSITTMCGYPEDIDYQILPDDIQEISEEKYKELRTGIQNNKLLYLDENEEIQLRDKYTKLVDGEWIPDNEAIAERDRLILVAQASYKFTEYEQYSIGYRYSKLTEQEKSNLYAYLDALDDIIKGIDTTSTELSTEPF